MTGASTVPATEPYGLRRPDVAQAREALRQLYGAAADDHWATLTVRAGITGTESDNASFTKLVEAMLTADPVTALCGRGLIIRMTTYEHLSQAHAIVRSAG